MPPKTARSRRIVPLPDAVVDALKLRRSNRRPIGSQLALGSGRTWAWSLPRASADPLSPRNGCRDFQRLVGPPAVFGCTICGTPLLRLCWPTE